MYKKILIALEGKSTDQAAIVYATALALESNAHVTLLQVIQLAQTGDDGMRALQLEPGAWAWRRLISGCVADGVQRKASIPTLFVSDGTRRAPIAAREMPPPDSPLAGFDHIHP